MKKIPNKTTYGRVTITKRGNGFRIRWRENKMPQEMTTTDYTKACKLAPEINARLERGQVGNPNCTFAELAVLATQRSEYSQFSDDSWQNIRSLVRNYIVPDFGDLKASSVRREDLMNYVNKLLLNDELSKYTVSKVRLILVRTCAEGMRRGIWASGANPSDGLRLPQSREGQKNNVQLQAVPKDRIPKEEEVQRLLNVAWEARPLHGFILELAARSGLRWSEIMGLKPEDFDFDNRIINVDRARRELHDGTVIEKPTKTPSGTRMAIISKVSVKKLRDFVEMQPTNEFICRSATGGIVRKTHFVKPLRRYKAKANFPSQLSTHSLRHFFGTYGLRVGVKLVDVSKMIGHANPKTTLALYAHGDSESVERGKAFL